MQTQGSIQVEFQIHYQGSSNSKVQWGETLKVLTSKWLKMGFRDLLSGGQYLQFLPRPSGGALMIQMVIVRLRKLVDSYLSLGQPDSAVHWADKLVTLSEDLNQQEHLQRGSSNGVDQFLVAEDVHRLGRGLLATRQPHRAAHLVRSSGLHTKHLGCCHVATMALYQVRLGKKYLYYTTIFRQARWRRPWLCWRRQSLCSKRRNWQRGEERGRSGPALCTWPRVGFSRHWTADHRSS